MQEIKIRGLDGDIKSKLEQSAKSKGLSLSKYVCNILTEHALNPMVKTTEEKYANFVKDITSLYQKSENDRKEQQNRIDRFLEDNLFVLNDIKELLSSYNNG